MEPKTSVMILRRLRHYLVHLETPKLILWCYFFWYAVITLFYFDPAPNLWFSSLGISFLVGYALNIAARQKGQRQDKWVFFRLYLFPFCVSSYAAIIKDKEFILLFPTQTKPLLFAIITCLSFLVCTVLIRRTKKQTTL